MSRGLAVSLLLHAALLAWALISIQSMPELRPETEAISVAIITPSELTRLKQGDPEAKELEAKAKENPQPTPSEKEAPKPKPVTAPPPPAPEPPTPAKEAAKPQEAPAPAKAEPKPDPIAEKIAALPPEPAPGPTPEEKRQLEEKAEQERQAEEQRKAEEKRKADEKKKAEEKKKADEKKKAEEKKKLEEQKKLAAAKVTKSKEFSDRIAALLDKTPDKRGAPPASPVPPTQPTDYTGKTAGERHGRDTVLSAREQDLLKGAISAQLRNCWRLPGAGGGIETTVVTLRWRLNADGTLDGSPQVQRPQTTPVFQIAAEAAVRAVQQCQPFNLPQEKYNAWRTITWDFDPREFVQQP